MGVESYGSTSGLPVGCSKSLPGDSCKCAAALGLLMMMHSWAGAVYALVEVDQEFGLHMKQIFRVKEEQARRSRCI